MADEVKLKKPEGKSVGKPADKGDSDVKKDPFVEIVTMAVGAFILLFLANNIMSVVNNSRLLSLDWRHLSPEAIILSHTVPVSSIESPMNGQVVSKNDNDVFDSPAGKKIGKQKTGARGKIIQGPVTINGQKYWYVDYDSDPDGWVKEDDIGYLLSEPTSLEKGVIYLLGLAKWFKIFSIIFVIICALCITYLILKLTKLRTTERGLLYPKNVATHININPRWERIINQMDSENGNDWRLAILEADIMLSEILDRLYLPGETIGDKLKAVERSDFTTIDNAWEAHKIRNQIAHDGETFVMSQREAKRIIDLYRTVFEEFQVI